MDLPKPVELFAAYHEQHGYATFNEDINFVRAHAAASAQSTRFSVLKVRVVAIEDVTVRTPTPTGSWVLVNNKGWRDHVGWVIDFDIRDFANRPDHVMTVVLDAKGTRRALPAKVLSEAPVERRGWPTGTT